MNKFSETNALTYKEGMRAAFWGAIFPFFASILFNGLNAVIVWYGSVLAKQDKITVGGLTSFMLFMVQLIFNFVAISFAITNLAKMSGAS